MLLFQEYVQTNREAFLTKVKEIANRIMIDPNWLMAVMYKESNLKPDARNPYSGATGLIQFMPSTANELGTTTGNLRSMSNLDQLVYVEKYFTRYRGRLKSFVDTYFAVFFPVAIGKPADWVIQANGLSAGLIASQNPGMDRNKDGKITVAEVEEWLFSGMPPATAAQLKKKS